MTVSFSHPSSSETKDMPGGGPQGTVLGMFLFLILINQAGFANQNRNLGEKLATAASKRDEIENMHAKYVDDMTIAQSINLKKDLTNDPDKNWTKPPRKRDRHEQLLPREKNQIQTQLNQLCSYADENQMQLNKDKTKVMLFNPLKQWDFMPEIEVGGQNLEVVEVYKLVGVQISSNLKWNENTDYITKKAYSRLWMIKRLKNLGLNTASLLEVYKMQIRSLLEFGAVVWHSMLSDQNTREIERVQKSAIAVILGPSYVCYENALALVDLERLDMRRVKLSLSFAKKTAKHPLHSSWFKKQHENAHMNTRTIKPTFIPTQARTQRLFKSPIPYLTKLLNNDSTKTTQK